MSVTSFRSDPARIRKELEISTYAGQYYLNTPGQGSTMPFFEEPHMRLQSWGANYDADHILDIQEQLRGTAHKLTKSGIHHQYNDTQFQHYTTFAPRTAQAYPIQEPFVKETRISHPAWMLRDLDAKYWRFEQPWLDPLEHTELPYGMSHDVNSKREAKNTYQYVTTQHSQHHHHRQQNGDDHNNNQEGMHNNNNDDGNLAKFVDAWLPRYHSSMSSIKK